MGVDWRRRILTLVVGVPTALWLLLSDVTMPLLVSIVCALCLLEFESNICAPLAPRRRVGPARLAIVVGGGTLVCVAAWGGDKDVHVISFHLLSADNADQIAMSALLLDVFALVFIAAGLSHAILLRYAHATYGPGLQLLGLVTAWVCDSGALVAGAFFGRAKLAPAISPGKTVIGALAGIASSVITVLAFFALSHSFVKRVAGVKDSGVFFPGHGGCLDRMDSVLLAAPFLYFYCRLAL
ncbi:hypothetical protein PybrP1_012073 [[Pythium] brassicae (nom. inval.)]|nr:hypothetical protein PybrP1_012073 [[Pythium] brassicae (nom. inval.)]